MKTFKFLFVYDNSFTQKKQYNAHEEALRAVLEIMYSYIEAAEAENIASVTHTSVCV